MSYNNEQHEQSQKLAKKEINARMRGRRSALRNLEHIAVLKRFLYEVLGQIGTLIELKDRHLFYSVAVELVPLGSYNAEICFPPAGPPFVLLDTGTIDFIGNMTALYLQLGSNSKGEDVFPLSDQRVIDYLYSSALIYFDKYDWETRRDAIYAPKLNYSEISPNLIPRALSFSTAHILFIVLHELGHVIADANGGFFGTNSDAHSHGIIGDHFEEGFADLIAFDLILKYSLGLPSPQKAAILLSGVDIALASISLIQSAFPVDYDKENKIIKVNESFSHPIAAVRRDLFQKYITEKLTEKLSKDLLIFGSAFDEIMYPYAEAIRNGAKPSSWFHEKRAKAKMMFG